MQANLLQKSGNTTQLKPSIPAPPPEAIRTPAVGSTLCALGDWKGMCSCSGEQRNPVALWRTHTHTHAKGARCDWIFARLRTPEWWGRPGMVKKQFHCAKDSRKVHLEKKSQNETDLKIDENWTELNWPLDSSAWHTSAFSSIAAHSSPFAWLQNDPNSL